MNTALYRLKSLYNDTETLNLKSLGFVVRISGLCQRARGLGTMDYAAKAPIFRSPFTDFTQIFGRIDIQLHGTPQCKRFELKYLDCMDAYGVEKGSVKCSDAFEDFIECMRCSKQEWRYEQMRAERERQIKEGKLEKKYLESPPPEIIYPMHF